MVRNIMMRSIKLCNAKLRASKLRPEEYAIFGIALVTMLWFAVMPQRLIWFDSTLGLYTLERIIIPAFAFWIATFFIRVWQKNSRENRQENKQENRQLLHQLIGSALEAIRLWGAFYVVLIIHFNFKINLGVWRTTFYDTSLWRLDQAWFGGAIDMLRGWHAQWLPIDPTTAYVLVYEALFIIGFIVLRAHSRHALRMGFIATVMTLFIGTGVYYIWPAIGPFLFSAPISPHMQAVTQQMLAQHTTYLASHGTEYLPGYLLQGLAGMPSLHLAGAIVFTWYAWKYARYALVIYIPATLFILLEAPMTGWHYVTDLIMGCAIALLSIWLTTIAFAKTALTKTTLIKTTLAKTIKTTK